MAGALHLVYCSFCPALLLELYDSNGAQITVHKVKIEAWHRLEICVGACFLVFLAVRELNKLLYNPTH